MTYTTGQIIRGALILLGFLVILGFIVYRSVKKADDPARRLFHWIITAPILVVMLLSALSMSPFGVFVIVGCAVVISILWTPAIGAKLASPLTSAFDGGDLPPELKPAYSVAEARARQGKYQEAVHEICKQLEQFPDDFEGLMMLSRIQAENLRDLEAAEMTVERICNQPNHPPAQIVSAFFALADWHLSVYQDVDRARAALERVIELYPNSQSATGAAQRIAHLATPEGLDRYHNPHSIAVPTGIRNLGLRKEATPPPPTPSPEQLAAEYVRHLTEHPLDTEVREKLAILYVDHYQRLDLAAGELEQLLALEQPLRLKAKWLNTLADLQVRSGEPYEAIRATLERIIDLAPNLAAAENARKRIDHLRLELKAKEKSQAVKLGSYEQNIGLKGGRRLPHEL